MIKIGIALIFSGIAIVSWCGYQHWHVMQSVDNLEGGAKVSGIQQDSDIQKTFIPDLSHLDYQQGEAVADLVIPKLAKSYKVFWGTDEDTLAKGVGMYVGKWTVPPGHGGHTVLSGHRDSVFNQLSELKEGDVLYITYHGEDYEYKINKIWITDADDSSVIVNKKNPTLTLTTCYPFEYIGNAPDRYIIQAYFIKKGTLK